MNPLPYTIKQILLAVTVATVSLAALIIFVATKIPRDDYPVANTVVVAIMGLISASIAAIAGALYYMNLATPSRVEVEKLRLAFVQTLLRLVQQAAISLDRWNAAHSIADDSARPTKQCVMSSPLLKLLCHSPF